MIGCFREICVGGLNLERLMQQATDQQMHMSRIRRKGSSLVLWVAEEHISAFLALAEKGGWTADVGRRKGTGRFLDGFARRWLMFSCLALAFCLILTSLQLIWGIEVTGADVYQADISEYLDRWPVRLLTWKKQVDLSSLQDALEWRYPDVAWIECGWRGPVLSITMNQGVPIGDAVDDGGWGHVVASRDGVVDSVATLAGTALVKPGDIVRKGQMLILGEERTGAEDTRAVMARGIVKARVWEGVSLRMSARETVTYDTGRQEERWNIICPCFALMAEDEIDYEAADVELKQMQIGGLFFPFILQRKIIKEVMVEEQSRSRAELEAEAKAGALRLLEQKTGNCDDFVDKWVDCCMIEDEVLEAVAIGERLVDIAQPQRDAY